MKMLQRLTVLLFAVVLILPMVCFNFAPDSISVIDNRELAESPLTASGDFATNVDNYVSDRLGFRDEFIKYYTILNDSLFDKMVHPSYVYGKDQYVFGPYLGLTVYNQFSDYHVAFANMVKQIQTYCESRNVPFLFVFNPAKPAIYSDKIADGTNYNRSWVPLFLAELDALNVNYVDNTVTMTELRSSGVDGYNKQYDAGHWNDIGAYYGTNAMLKRLHETNPSVYVIPQEEISVSEVLQTTLPVSEFPIYEYVPSVSLPTSATNIADKYSSLELNAGFKHFDYYVNEQRLSEGSPRTLVFQGSYMIGFGYKYLMHSLGEYIAVHDYQNVLDFDYYFNIFQPECVIFEVAEYTLNDTYFDYEKMQVLQFNPAFATVEESDNYAMITPGAEEITVETTDSLTTIRWMPSQDFQYVWIQLEEVHDMRLVNGVYEVTIDTARYDQFGGQLVVYATTTDQ